MRKALIPSVAVLLAACSGSDNQAARVDVDTMNLDLQLFCPPGTVKQCKGTVCTCVKAPLDQIVGTVSGLTGTGLTLINDGTVLGVSQNGQQVAFSVPQGQLYDVQVDQQPTGQACAVSNGYGYAPGGPFQVSCGQPYTVSGTIEGLEANTSPPNALTLQLYSPGVLTTTQVEVNNGHFAFPTALPNGAEYEVSAISQPPGQTCVVWGGSGFVPGANVTNVVVRCGSPTLTFTPLATTPGTNAPATWLMQDGTVLIQQADAQTLSRLTPNASGSYVNGTWSSAGSLLQSQNYFASQVLGNGNLVACGGEYSSAGGETNYCEIYNPFTQTPSVLAPPPGWGSIGDSPSSILPNGAMLVGNTNGYGSQSAILDPTTLTWSFVGGDGDNEQGYTLLQTGDVLTTEVYQQTSMRYSPGSAGFVFDANVPVQLGSGSEIGPGVTLADGRVIWFGATGHTAIYTPTAAGQNGSWQAGPELPRYGNSPYVSSDAFAVLEPTGRVLLSVSGPTGSQLAEYDPTLNAFALVTNGPQNFATNASPLLLLPNGHALFAPWNVGWYDVQFSGTTVSAPTITSFPSAVSRGTTATLAGTQLCGLSQVSMMGDDNQQGENFPIVRVTGAGITRYLRAHDVSTHSIAPNRAGTVSVDVPSNLAPGSYSLQVVAMGIASAPVTVQVQ